MSLSVMVCSRVVAVTSVVAMLTPVDRDCLAGQHVAPSTIPSRARATDLRWAHVEVVTLQRPAHARRAQLAGRLAAPGLGAALPGAGARGARVGLGRAGPRVRRRHRRRA